MGADACFLIFADLDEFLRIRKSCPEIDIKVSKSGSHMKESANLLAKWMREYYHASLTPGLTWQLYLVFILGVFVLKGPKEDTVILTERDIWGGIKRMRMGLQLQPSLLKQNSMCFITWNTYIHNSSFFRLSIPSLSKVWPMNWQHGHQLLEIQNLEPYPGLLIRISILTKSPSDLHAH